MRKQIIALGLASMMALSLVGCGENKDGEIVLGQYKGIKVGQSVKDKVTEEVIDEQVKLALEEYGDLKDTGKGAVEGDTINIDFAGYMDGEAFDGGTAKDQTLVLGEGGFIDGFEDQLVGHSVGEEFDIVVTFPENYGKEELNGKEATFKIKMNKVQELILPELTDDFVAQYFGKLYPVATVEEFYDYIEQQLLFYNIENAITSDLVKSCEVKTWPEGEVDKLFNDVYAQYESYIPQMYGMTLTQYYTTLGYTEESFKALVRSGAEEEVKTSMMVKAIAKAEKIEISDEEYQVAAKQMAQTYGLDSVAKVEEQFGKEEVMNSILRQEVFEWICEHVEFYDDSNETTTAAKE